jgi:hypothetical protein
VITKKAIATPRGGFLSRWTRIEHHSSFLCGSFLDNKTWLSPFQQRDSNARSTAARLGAPHSRDPNRGSSARSVRALARMTRGIVPGRSRGRHWAALRVAVLSQAYCGELSSPESQPLTLDSIGLLATTIERDRLSGIRRFAGRSRMVQSRLLKATSELERISNSAGVREAKDMLMVLGDIRAC